MACGKVNPNDVDARRGDSNNPVVDARAPDARIDAMIDAPSGHTVAANPILWLRADDDPTNGATDSATAGHSATCTSCPALVAGKFVSAYQFTTDRIDVATTGDLGPGTAFTFATWVRLDAASTGITVVACKAQGSLDCSYGLLIETGKAGWYSAGGQHLVGTIDLPVNTWHHLAMTWDGATKVGYLDGVQGGTVAVASIPVDAAAALSIGDRAASSIPFAGTVDDVVFYNRVLTAQEITALATP
jgi:hypothetical protein